MTPRNSALSVAGREVLRGLYERHPKVQVVGLEGARFEERAEVVPDRGGSATGESRNSLQSDRGCVATVPVRCASSS